MNRNSCELDVWRNKFYFSEIEIIKYLSMLNAEMFCVVSCLTLIWVSWCLIGALVYTSCLHFLWWDGYSERASSLVMNICDSNRGKPGSPLLEYLHNERHC